MVAIPHAAKRKRAKAGGQKNKQAAFGRIASSRPPDRGSGPKRSMLFVIFTGEEKGLLGSRFFAGRPTVPERILSPIWISICSCHCSR